jgi:hypothetical protein
MHSGPAIRPRTSLRLGSSTWASALLIAIALGASLVDAHARGPGSVAVAWNDPATGRGAVAAIGTAAPWGFVTAAVETGADPLLHANRRTLYVVSPADGTLTAIDTRCWTVSRVYALGAGAVPQDVAVVRRHAYVTRRDATHLLRLDLDTGATSEVVDLGVFADPDGVPDLGTMAIYKGRLFVQLRRIDTGGATVQPALAVVDLASEQIVDVDPGRPGLQPIALVGTSPRFRMQVEARSRRLFVSATGGFFDHGGLEAIDLDALRSTGLVIAEEDGQVGADLGAFVMVAPDRGFLTYSTDLLLSSHLHSFTLAGDIGDELHVSLDYFAPALAYHRRTGLLFVPAGTSGQTGVEVFDAESEARLTHAPTPTSGAPTDLVPLRSGPRQCS